MPACWCLGWTLGCWSASCHGSRFIHFCLTPLADSPRLHQLIHLCPHDLDPKRPGNVRRIAAALHPHTLHHLTAPHAAHLSLQSPCRSPSPCPFFSCRDLKDVSGSSPRPSPCQFRGAGRTELNVPSLPLFRHPRSF